MRACQAHIQLAQTSVRATNAITVVETPPTATAAAMYAATSMTETAIIDRTGYESAAKTSGGKLGVAIGLVTPPSTSTRIVTKRISSEDQPMKNASRHRGSRITGSSRRRSMSSELAIE